MGWIFQQYFASYKRIADAFADCFNLPKNWLGNGLTGNAIDDTLRYEH